MSIPAVSARSHVPVTDSPKSVTPPKYNEFQERIELGAQMGIASCSAQICYQEGMEYLDSQEYVMALFSFKRAAEYGYEHGSYAELELGVMYAEGKGVTSSDEMAFYYFLRVASRGRGFLDAKFNVGLMYNHGRGVAQSAEKAAEWFQKAADENLPEAEYEIGLMHFYGVGGKEKSTESALQWMKKAAAQGLTIAREWLQKNFLEKL